MIIGHRRIGETVELRKSRNVFPHLCIIGMINMGTVFVDINSFHGFRINVSRHIRAFIDDQNLFPSVSRFSCEHRSVQSGADHQIVVFHNLYIFPFSQSHSCAYVISVRQPSLRRHVSEPPE